MLAKIRWRVNANTGGRAPKFTVTTNIHGPARPGPAAAQSHVLAGSLTGRSICAY